MGPVALRHEVVARDVQVPGIGIHIVRRLERRLRQVDAREPLSERGCLVGRRGAGHDVGLAAPLAHDGPQRERAGVEEEQEHGGGRGWDVAGQLHGVLW